jgi:hypothetical protein
MFSRNPTKHSVYQICTHFLSHPKPKWARPICDPNKHIVCRRLWRKCFSDQIDGSYVFAMEVRNKWRAPMIVLCTKVEPLPFGRKGLQQMNPPPLWCLRGGTNKAFQNLIATAADTVKFQMCSSKLWNSRSSLEQICNCSWHGNHSDVYNPGTTVKLNKQYQS